MTDTAQNSDRVTEFLRRRTPGGAVPEEDFDLIENRVLDSLGFVEFLYTLEEQTGRRISLESVTPEDFRTIARIRERFLR